MKKIFAFAIAAVTMTVGCQKIQELVNPDRNQTQIENDDPVEIQFTTNLVNADIETRAAVTELTSDHQLYIYGINNTSQKSEIINVPAIVSENVPETEDGSTSKGLTLDKAYFYNGTLDRYSFYGYYVDNAVTGTPAPNDNFELDVTITGQQDILHAKAESDLNEPATGNVWSAQSARKNSHPNLKFEHQLSQFSFEVRNQGVADVTLKGLSLNTVNKGTFTVAARGNGNVGLVPSSETGELTLTMSDLNLPKKPSDDDNGYLEVGTKDGGETTQTNIMVFPGVEYTLKLTLYQSGMLRTITWPLALKQTDGEGNKSDKNTLAGESYNVQITIYSLNEISINASLVNWKEVTVDPIDTEKVPENDINDDYDPVVSVNPSVINIPADDNSETADVNELTTEVKVTMIDDNDSITPTEDLDWVVVNLKEETTDTYLITVTKNEGVARNGDVKFTSTKYGYVAKLKVNQAAAL